MATQITIGKPAGAKDPQGRSWRPILVKRGRKTAEAKILVGVVNGRATWSFDGCSNDAFDFINSALSAKGEKAVAAMVQP